MCSNQHFNQNYLWPFQKFYEPHLKTLLHKAKEAQKRYIKGDPHNFQNYNKAEEGFIQAYHVDREENLKDIYSKLDPAAPHVVRKMDKITGPQVTLVIRLGTIMATYTLTTEKSQIF